MNNIPLRWFGTLVLASAISAPVAAGELGDLFDEYQLAIESGSKSEIAQAARVVFEFTSENLPDSNKSRAASALNYGSALIALKRYGEAERVLSKAMRVYRSSYGDAAEALVDPLMLKAQARAGNVGHSSRRRYRDYIDQALEIVERSRGKNSFLYASLLQEGGRIGIDIAGDRFALEYLEHAYTAFTGPLAEYKLERFLASFYLGKFFLLKKSYRQAEPFLVEALALVDSSSEKDTQLELTARAFLVEVYDSLGENEKSIAQCRAIGKATPFNMDQEPKPLFRRNPRYPTAALRSQTEGYAIAEFTINDAGFAKDIAILETKGSGSFGRATHDYLEALRFAPRFEDGVAVDTPGRKMKVSFNIAN
ncbi:TonB family protein [Microbulbifer elongatus]|uniref:TonB family protein n=1 Tax=Microbulbifer elongatus TaxID=86173 RepID=A0ABT1NZJ0_9GAMM|nr:TonB family protein [Microbulbifer elongatus]MCQ3828707.1 TonB family protein [Microbulbifer elongatus]